MPSESARTKAIEKARKYFKKIKNSSWKKTKKII